MSAVNLTIVDADGDKSVISLDFLGGFSGDVDGLIENVWAIVNPLINGQLIDATVTISADISDLTNAAAAAISDVQEAAKFVFRSLIGNFPKTITLPTFIETFFTNSGGGSEVDLTNASVIAFAAMIEDGVDDGGGTPVEIDFTTSHGEDIGSLSSAKQSFGKNRK